MPLGMSGEFLWFVAWADYLPLVKHKLAASGISNESNAAGAQCPEDVGSSGDSPGRPCKL